MGKTYFLLGGARSGKSEYAEKLALSISSRVGYVATSRVTDDEMRKRVEIHKQRRPESWVTFEIEKDGIEFCDFERIIRDAEVSRLDVLLIDCVTNLLFRLIYKFDLDNLEVIDNMLEERIENEVNKFFNNFMNAIKRIADLCNLNVIIVSNEVGLGLVPSFPFGRIFRDMLGQINKKIAEIADEVHFFIAGFSIKLK